MQDALRTDLIDLLQGRRPPYEGLKALDLISARASPASARVAIERSIPTADAKKLLKSWTKAKTAPEAREDVVALLIAQLVDEKSVSRV